MTEAPETEWVSDLPPNTASRARDRLEPLSWAHDWEAVRAAVGPTFEWEDRRPLMRLRGDVDILLKNMELTRFRDGPRHDRRLVATFGDRIALEAVTWSADSADADYMVELLSLIEVDADGLLVADIVFDATSRDEAFAEARARFAAGEAAGLDTATAAALDTFGRGVSGHDWDSARSALADDFVVRDHQKLGLLDVDSADSWIDTYRAMSEQAANWGGETYRSIEWDDHGCVIVLRQFGDLVDGGAFERRFLCVFFVQIGLIRRLELFDLDDEERALARFEELRPEQQ